MDKGKKSIQEEKEEEFLSLVNDYHTNNLIPSPLPPPEFGIFSNGPAGCSPKETTAPLVDEMDQVDKEDIFSEFWSMDFSEFPDPLLEQFPMLPDSNAGVLPIPQADGMADQALPPISQNLTGRPPRPPPAPADDKEKPLVFRKVMPPHVLAEVAIHDPKRAKRIVNNRMSAHRAKERKKLHVSMLEHKLQTLKSKSTKLTARLKSLEIEGTTLNAENNCLKNQMEIMSKQIHLQDFLNDEIRSEIQHMKTMLGQNIPNLGALVALCCGSSNQDMNALLGATQQFPEFQLQNPFQEQQAQFDFQQQPYPGLQNFGVHQNDQQQLILENPLPYDHYQMQNEQRQAPQFQQAQASQFQEAQAPQFQQAQASQFQEAQAPQFQQAQAPQFQQAQAPQFQQAQAHQFEQAQQQLREFEQLNAGYFSMESENRNEPSF